MQSAPPTASAPGERSKTSQTGISNSSAWAPTRRLAGRMIYGSTPYRTRTCDPRIRNPLLYPAELREQIVDFEGFRDGVGWGSDRV